MTTTASESSGSDDEFMLTTTDNPFDPSTQFNEWYAHDVRNGHHTSSLLARLTNSSNDMSEEDQKFLLNQAIDEIIANDELGIYKRVPVRKSNASEIVQ